jgi:hypothetical protein
MKPIKIQSISDIITNSSTEVFCMYSQHDKEEIKKLVNAILALSNSVVTFDDLFEIKMDINWDAAYYMWNDDEEIAEKYENADDFFEFLKTLNDEQLKEYEQNFVSSYSDLPPMTLYDGYTVSVKQGVIETETIKKAKEAINYIKNIFDYEAAYC